PVRGSPAVRVALTGSGTLGPVAAHVRVACGQAGIHPAVHVSDFGQWAQDLLSADSALYAFEPELIVLFLSPSVLFPKAVNDVGADEPTLRDERARGLAQLRAVLDGANHHAPSASVLVHTFPVPDRSPFGVSDLRQARGQRARIEELNDALGEL